MFRKINSFCKDILLYSRLFYLIYPFRHFFLFLYNFSMLTAWISKNNKGIKTNDFLRLSRKYTDRTNGFMNIVEKFDLCKNNPILYLEFGVASGVSFRWWMTNSKHPYS